ncbi:DUF3576 domain-containing protein [Candidatus Pelagibacter sp.]|nr:DUF3576 domain-containing protein [Candidatus Pelagibacter sp.]
MNKIKVTVFCIVLSLILSACNGKLPGADARKVSYDPKERVRKNLEEGKAFRLDSAFKNNSSGGNFEFASSNELWRASLDTIDFIPIATANYSGGILITDWYSENVQNNESIKISIRFLTNEVRSDALDIKVFYKKCETVVNCIISEKEGNLRTELTKEILKKAAIYKKQTQDKNFKPYLNTSERNKDRDSSTK